ncbi:MAG TPA: hypothetical protein VIK72_09920 [Clostridiaceae bacterium]
MKFSLYRLIFKNPLSVRLWNEKFFVISFLLAVVTSFMSAPKLDYIDSKVILCLFDLMVIGCAFEDLKIMDRATVQILNKCSNLRLVSLVMLSLTFFSSMLLTNDVALLTFASLCYSWSSITFSFKPKNNKKEFECSARSRTNKE